jgi:hypothetical protein
MKYYLRNTHINGQFRGEAAFLTPILEFEGLGVHGLESDRWISFQEYVDFHINYANQFPNDFAMPLTTRLNLELVELVRIGLALESETYDD